MARRSVLVVLALVVSVTVLAGCGSSGSAAQPAVAKAFCQAVEPAAHLQPDTFIAVKTQVVNDGGHSGYPSLDKSAIRFRTALAHEVQGAQGQAAVRGAASQVLAACTRLGF
jgi:predicted small secreted protein